LFLSFRVLDTNTLLAALWYLKSFLDIFCSSDKQRQRQRHIKDINDYIPKLFFVLVYGLWQYGLWSFKTGYTKLERFLHKNQHAQRKLLNFENWTNGEPQ
jgi:hypothetical protein